MIGAAAAFDYRDVPKRPRNFAEQVAERKRLHELALHPPVAVNSEVWTRSFCIALAASRCAKCYGLGMSLTVHDGPCPCVLRACFRSCYRHWRNEVENEAHIVTCDHSRPRSFGVVGGSYGIRSAEYIADFLSVAYRALNGRSKSETQARGLKTSKRWEIFKWHFMYGADWSLVAPKVRLSRGALFHAIYDIEATLGRAYAELLPYALFPVADYFTAARSGAAALPAVG